MLSPPPSKHVLRPDARTILWNINKTMPFLSSNSFSKFSSQNTVRYLFRLRALRSASPSPSSYLALISHLSQECWLSSNKPWSHCTFSSLCLENSLAIQMTALWFNFIFFSSNVTLEVLSNHCLIKYSFLNQYFSTHLPCFHCSAWLHINTVCLYSTYGQYSNSNDKLHDSRHSI